MSESIAPLPRIKVTDHTTFRAQLTALRQAFANALPELEATVRDPAMGVEGYVVVWNTGISVGGPLERAGKGGTRITPGVSLDEVRMLARTMALKNAAAGLPLGGAKSGLKLDPDSAGFEARYRRFVRLCAPMLVENGGPFGGFGFDIGARPEHALWACDELQSSRCFTGKPAHMGGTDYDREGIAGLGVAVAGKTMMQATGGDASNATFAIQGMGAMGAAVLRYFSEDGGRIVAIGDPRYGGTWCFGQPPSAELHRALIAQEVGPVKALLAAEAHRISEDPSAVLFQTADILFPCALQDVITAENVAQVKAHYVCEAANSPLTANARQALHARGVRLTPDFIANAGGIIAAFVELTSMGTDKAQEAKELTRSKIAANVTAVFDMSREFQCTPEDAAWFLALSRMRGTFN